MLSQKPIKKKERKERTIINGIIDIDDVSVGAGIDYINWAKIARIKLRQRELILLQKRQEACNQTINAAIQQFTSHCIQRFVVHPNRNIGIPIYEMERENLIMYLQDVQYKIIASNSNIMRRCRQSITDLLVAWDGYKPRNELRSFRKYFQSCRRWFDEKKVQMLGALFFLPIMAIVKKYTESVAAQFFGYPKLPLQKQYSDYLNLLIVKSLLEGMIDPSNARSMWLIPASAYPELQIRSNERECHQTTKDLRDEYLKLIRFKSKIARKVFEDELLRFYTDSRQRRIRLLQCGQIPYVQGQHMHMMAPVQNKVVEVRSFGYECTRSGYTYNRNAHRTPYACAEQKPFESCGSGSIYPPCIY
eukprot:460438_1